VKHLTRSLALAVALAGTTAALPAVANADHSPKPTPTLWAWLNSDSRRDGADGFDRREGDFDIATELLRQYPDLVTAADSPGAITVFLPTDEAFRTTVRAVTGKKIRKEADVFAEINTLGADTVRSMLLYHVINTGRLSYKDLVAAKDTALTTQNGATITVKVTGKGHKRGVVLQDNDPDQRDPLVRDTTSKTSNATVHVIDRALLATNI
jgi:uncharacterized surface protein with fasciclin (FAS1) repeats